MDDNLSKGFWAGIALIIASAAAVIMLGMFFIASQMSASGLTAISGANSASKTEFALNLQKYAETPIPTAALYALVSKNSELFDNGESFLKELKFDLKLQGKIAFSVSDNFDGTYTISITP